jgi:hypothetical protein
MPVIPATVGRGRRNMSSRPVLATIETLFQKTKSDVLRVELVWGSIFTILVNKI